MQCCTSKNQKILVKHILKHKTPFNRATITTKATCSYYSNLFSNAYHRKRGGKLKSRKIGKSENCAGEGIKAEAV